MLDKKDLKAIAEIVEKNITKSLTEFYQDIIGPYFEQLTKRHDKHDNDFDTVFRKFDEIDDHLINHEKRIKKLETTLQP